MTAASVLSDLRSRDICLDVTPNGDLRFSAPPGALTDDLRTTIRSHKQSIVAFLRARQTPTIAPRTDAVEACRRRAEAAEDLQDIWSATVDEIALRWQASGPPDARQWLPERVDIGIQDEIAAAIRASNRALALTHIEEWRRRWIRYLGQHDFESTGDLNVMDGFRAASKRHTDLYTTTGANEMQSSARQPVVRQSRQRTRSPLQLSDEQRSAIDRLTAWIDDPTAAQTFTLAGLAGTGKTTLIAEFVDRIEGIEVVVAAFTGKAASVLRKKGLPSARTLHSLMYTLDGKDAQGRLHFRRAESIKADLVIVDEASMISNTLHRDLLSFRRRVLYVGDHGQLEPIGGDAGIMKNPQIRLETIHRQHGDSSIIGFAHAIRKGTHPGDAPTGAEIEVLPKDRFLDLLGSVDVMLCGYNNTRHEANRRARKKLGFTGRYPQVGERVVCLRNEQEVGLYNGLVLKVTAVRDDGRDVLVLDLVDDDGQEFPQIPALKEQFGQNSLASHAMRHVALIDFAACLTTHKAQGSEWDTVAVLDEISSHWDIRRWRYTAATRAAKKLYYCCAPAATQRSVHIVSSTPTNTAASANAAHAGTAADPGGQRDSKERDMRMSGYVSKYLRANSITEPTVVTISSVREQRVGKNGDEESKPVCHFEEFDQGLVLNSTMIRQLIELLGTDESDEWIGKQVTLYHDPDVSFGGRQVGGLRFRAVPPPEKEVPF